MNGLQATPFIERALRGIQASKFLVLSEHDLNDTALRDTLLALLDSAAYYTGALNQWLAITEKLSFGDKLRALRATINKSQAEVAEELAISQPTLSNLEQRETAPRNENTVQALAKYYDVPAAYLLGVAAGRESETE